MVSFYFVGFSFTTLAKCIEQIRVNWDAKDCLVWTRSTYCQITANKIYNKLLGDL